MKQFPDFLRAITDDWIGKMSGGGGLLLTVVGFFVPATWQPRLFLALGLLALFSACYRAWLSQNRQRLELLERLEPRLEFVYERGVKPFFEESPGQSGSKIRSFRLGLRNLGATDIQQARLVLEACDPGNSLAVHPEHELQPMGKPAGTLTALVPPLGTILIEVAREALPAGQDRGELSLSYAQPVPNTLPPRGDERYSLTLRAEGGGPPIRCTIDLGGRLSWRMDGLKTTGPGAA
jgi:hypothetical protein